MSVELPALPAPAETTPRLVDFGAALTPVLGGPAQRLNRLGNRFAIDVTMPVLTPHQRHFYTARLVRAMTEGALMRFPQPGLAIGTPGSFVVNGAGQQGSSLNLRDGTPNYQFKEGQFFSIIYAGRRYLHMAASVWGANAQGRLIMPIVPMLRVSPNDGAIVEVAQPYIEGFLSGNELPWQIRTDHNGEVSFTITEAA